MGEENMALVNCAECNHLVSNKAKTCPYCGYEPKGDCKSCIYYTRDSSIGYGKCELAEGDFVREDKGVCPAVVKKCWCLI